MRFSDAVCCNVLMSNSYHRNADAGIRASGKYQWRPLPFWPVQTFRHRSLRNKWKRTLLLSNSGPSPLTFLLALPLVTYPWYYMDLSWLASIAEFLTKNMKSSLYRHSRCYAETCIKFRGSSPEQQLRKKVAAVASSWQHCVRFARSGNLTRISKRHSDALTTASEFLKNLCDRKVAVF